MSWNGNGIEWNANAMGIWRIEYFSCFPLFHRMQRSLPSNCATSWIKSWLNVSTFLQLCLCVATSRFPAQPWEHRLQRWPGQSQTSGLCPRPQLGSPHCQGHMLSLLFWEAVPALKVCFTGRVLWQGARGCLLYQWLLLGISCQEEGWIWLMLDNNQEKVLLLL